MDKLKIHCDKKNFNKITEEQLLYFGKVENEIIKNNKTFRDINNEDINRIIEYTDIENCDFIYYPYKISKNENLTKLIEDSEKYDKKILLYYNDDDDEIFNFKNSIFFRTSIYKSKKPKNYFSVPAFCNDLKKENDYFFKEKNKTPVIGFCGSLTHRDRKTMIDVVKNSKNLSNNFIIRNDFWGGKIWDHDIRQEYILNTLNSDFVICVRGAGNFSYRFYETLCLGKIPLILDTDMSFPFEDFINYDDKILKINRDDLKNIEDIVYNFWEKIDEYVDFQKSMVKFWDNYLSPIGHIKTLNKYKYEINKLLH